MGKNQKELREPGNSRFLGLAERRGSPEGFSKRDRIEGSEVVDSPATESSEHDLLELNRELTGLNARLRERIDQLSRTTRDLENLISNIDIPTLFLDQDLNIRSYTSAGKTLLELGPEDIGTSVEQVKTNLLETDLFQLSIRVLEKGRRLEQEARDSGGSWYLVRGIPYRTPENRFQGVVISFSEITRLKQATLQKELLTRFGEFALKESDLGAIFQEAAEIVSAGLEVEMTKVLELLPDEDKLLLRAGVGWKDGLVGKATVRTGERSQAGFTLMTGGPVVVADLTREKRFSGPALLTDHAVRSGLSTIIKPGADEVFGILGAHTQELRSFNEGDLTFLSAVANLLGIVLARLHEEQAMQRLAEAGAVGLAYFELKGRKILRPNEALLNMLKMQPEAFEKEGIKWDEITPPRYRAADRQAEREVLEKGFFTPFEKEYIQADGSRVPVLVGGALFSGIRGLGVCVVVDISEQKRAEEALRQLNETLEEKIAQRTAELERSQKRLRRMSQQAARAEQRERKRLAAGLHDEVQQLLVAVRMHVERHIGKHSDLQKAHQWLGKALESTRSLIFDLSPAILFEEGLEAGLHNLSSRFREQHGLEVDLQPSTSVDPLPDNLKMDLFQCVRELLFNVVKHSGVDHAVVRMERFDDWLRIEVCDRGRGFDIEAKSDRGHGLLSLNEKLHEHGGHLEVDSRPEKGTRVELKVPISGNQT